eukprot:6926541-Alexandrium_andersonii.AAC.1
MGPSLGDSAAPWNALLALRVRHPDQARLTLHRRAGIETAPATASISVHSATNGSTAEDACGTPSCN